MGYKLTTLDWGNTMLDLDLWGPSTHLSPISGFSTQILTTYADKVQLVNI